MNSSLFSGLDRRAWFKTSALAAAGLALGGRGSLRAQHETDRFTATPSVVNIGGNENPFGPAQGALMAVLQYAEQSSRYGYEAAGELAAMIAAQNGVGADQISMGNGSSEVLDDYATFLSRSGPGEVVTATPGYLKFTNAMAANGSTIVAVPTTKDMVHDLKAMAAAVGPKTKCVYICNPNNPTGTIVPAAELRAFVVEMAKKVPVFVDEAYLEFSDDFEGNTMAPLVAEGHNVVVARTFSKLYGMAGLRLGYGLMSAAVAGELNKISANFLGILAVHAGIASVQDPDYVTDVRAKVKAERDKLCATLKALGRTYAEPQGNFVFAHVGMPVAEFQAKMLAENVRVGRAFPPALDWCRISIGLPEEMAVCDRALRRVLV